MAKEIEIPELTDEQRQAVINQHQSTLAKKGGEAMKKRPREYFQEIGRKGAATRKKRLEEGGKY